MLLPFSPHAFLLLPCRQKWTLRQASSGESQAEDAPKLALGAQRARRRPLIRPQSSPRLPFALSLAAMDPWDDWEAKPGASGPLAAPAPAGRPPLRRTFRFQDWGEARTGLLPPSHGQKVSHPSSVATVARAAKRQGRFPDEAPAALAVPPPIEASEHMARITRVSCVLHQQCGQEGGEGLSEGQRVAC